MKKLKILSLFITMVLMSIVFAGCGDEVKITPYAEPGQSISKYISENAVGENTVKLEIQSMSINNPQFINVVNNGAYSSNITSIVLKDSVSYALGINIRSPIDTGDNLRQKDILIYIRDISNIHYIDNGGNYIIIKESPNQYYYNDREGKFHSYIADIYINKNKSPLSLGNNENNRGKSGTEVTTSQQIK